MRALNRIVCVLLAIAIAVAGVLTVVEVIAATTGNDPVFVKWHGFVNDLATNEWKTAGPRVAAIILIIVGLLLLLLALHRGKPATVALSTSASAVDMTTTRRSLQRSLSTSATDVDGISGAHVKVKRRKVVVKATASPGITKNDGQSRLTTAMQERLDRLSLADARRLTVSVRITPDRGTPDAPAGLADDDSTGSGSSGPGSQGPGSQGRAPVGASSNSGASE